MISRLWSLLLHLVQKVWNSPRMSSLSVHAIHQILTKSPISQLRSAILTAVPDGDDIPEIIVEALNEWKETEDLEGEIRETFRGV